MLQAQFNIHVYYLTYKNYKWIKITLAEERYTYRRGKLVSVIYFYSLHI
jgi:hypothetical protein